MSPNYLRHLYGIGAKNQITKVHGLTAGEDDSEVTTKKIWTEAEARAIDDTRANRELACKLDALVNIIFEFEAFTILGSFEIHGNNDEDCSDLIERVETFVSDIDLMATFREAFPGVRMHGVKYLQKVYESNQTRLKGEPKSLLHLQQLVAVERHTNPFNSKDFYLFQNLKIETDWKDPKVDFDGRVNWADQKEYRTKPQKVWYIKDGVNGVAEYPKISHTQEVEDPNNATGDIVIDLADIVEIRNNESGQSSITAALNEIFIKNHIILNLPNLVYLVLAPGIGVECQTHDKEGNWIVPNYPLASLKDANPTKYEQELSDYNDFEAEKQELANTLIEEWFRKGIMVYSDTMKPTIVESQQRFQAEMLELMIRLLNTEIAFALGFPMALLEARGVELATGREIKSVMATVLRGIQNQYQKIAMDIIYEQFPQEAKEAGIVFKLTELNPKDAKELADVRKVDADILKIVKEIGGSDDDLRALSRQYNLLDDFELSGGGLAGSNPMATAEAYPTKDLELSVDIVRRIAEHRKAVGVEL